MATLITLCSSCATQRVDPAYRALVKQENRIPPIGELGPGDKFHLRVHDQKSLSGDFTVSAGGTINYPYIGRIKVAGLTCAQLEDKIGKGLANGYLRNPSVSCSITEYNSKRIFVFGEVKKPGSFPYKSNLTIIEAFAMAGGFSERANADATKLTRVVHGVEVQVRVPMQEIVEGRRRNVKLLPGDVIYVPESPY